MNFPFFISKRYFVSKKSQSAINIISWISLGGVAVGTMALVVVLSVFNGFDDVIQSLFNSFDPDIKITLKEGKVFDLNADNIANIEHLQEVDKVTYVLEESALLQYGDKQYIAQMKGVSTNYPDSNPIKSKVSHGEFLLSKNNVPFALIGAGVAYYLGVDPNFVKPLNIYIPRRDADINDAENAFTHQLISISGEFSIEQDIDAKYFIVPYDFASKALDYSNKVSALEIKLKDYSLVEKAQAKINQIVGTEFHVKNRYQQQEMFYKIMKSEKWAIFFILTFILIVASLNIIGSLTMLIIDKKRDIQTFGYLGANWKDIRRIFLFNSWINVIIGAVIGLFIGLAVCSAQIYFGFIKLQGSGSFVIENYPVKIVATDILLVFFTVIAIGYLTSLIPVRAISRKYFED